jgi:hypothetical protein
MFTKEDKDTAHFIEIRNEVMTDRNDIKNKPCAQQFFPSSQGGCQVGIPTQRLSVKNSNLTKK